MTHDRQTHDSDYDDMQNETLRKLSLQGHVGFDSLPDQLVTKATQRGFTFNVLCVGETGIGKSTLMSTLFASKDFDMEQQSHSSPKVTHSFKVNLSCSILCVCVSSSSIL